MKAAPPATETTFNFWKENKISGLFQLTRDELIQQFKEWLPTENLEWHDYYGISDCLNVFISKKLNAIGNTENNFTEYREMEDLLKPIRRNYIEAVQSKIDAV